jgi:cell wall-associated NlpC family hydrolase
MAFALCTGVLVLSWPGAPGTADAAPSPSPVSTLKAQALALERRIAVQTALEQAAGEQLDQAEVRLGLDRAALARAQASLQRERAKVAAAKASVRRAAIEAYVAGDAAANQFGSLLTTGIANEGTVSTYAGLATERLSAAVAQLQADERRLAERRAQRARLSAAANLEVASAAANRQAALRAAASAQAALSRVKGRLAALIAKQEAAAAAAALAKARAAAAAAARARAAEARAAQRKRAAEAAAARRQAAAEANAALQAEQAAAQAVSTAQAVAQAQPSSPVVQQAAASASATASSPSSLGVAPIATSGSSPQGNLAVQAAERFLGVPYVWGGASSAGVDCSGLTMLAWQAAGVSLAHSAWYQYEETTRVSLQSLQPGDLLFYHFANDGPDPVTHVAMYVGSGPYGSQTIIQAPEPGQDVSFAPMYYLGLVGAGRPGLG